MSYKIHTDTCDRLGGKRVRKGRNPLKQPERVRRMKEEESMSWETRCNTELLLETLTANNVRE